MPKYEEYLQLLGHVKNETDKEIHEKISELKAEIKNQSKAVSEKEKEIQKLLSNIESEKRKNEEKLAQLDEMSGQCKLVELEKTKLSDDLNNKEKKLALIQKELATSEKTIKKQASQVNLLEQKVKSETEKINLLNSELKKGSTSADKTEAKIKALNKELDQSVELSHQQKLKIQKIEKDRDTIKGHNQQLKKLLKETEAKNNNEFYEEQLRKTNSDLDRLRNVYSRVYDRNDEIGKSRKKWIFGLSGIIILLLIAIVLLYSKDENTNIESSLESGPVTELSEELNPVKTIETENLSNAIEFSSISDTDIEQVKQTVNQTTDSDDSPKSNLWTTYFKPAITDFFSSLKKRTKSDFRKRNNNSEFNYFVNGKKINSTDELFKLDEQLNTKLNKFTQFNSNGFGWTVKSKSVNDIYIEMINDSNQIIIITD